jgi:hypothetical protein
MGPIFQEVLVDSCEFLTKEHTIVVQSRALRRYLETGGPKVPRREDRHDHDMIARPVPDIRGDNQDEARLVGITWLTGRMGQPDFASARLSHALSSGSESPSGHGAPNGIPGHAFGWIHSIRFGELPFHRPLQFAASPESQRLINHRAAVQFGMCGHVGVNCRQ